MSLLINKLQQPDQYAPCFNDMDFVFSAKTGMDSHESYLTELVVSGNVVSTTAIPFTISRAKDGIPFRNPRRVLQSYIDFDKDFNGSLNGVKSSPDFAVQYDVELGKTSPFWVSHQIISLSPTQWRFTDDSNLVSGANDTPHGLTVGETYQFYMSSFDYSISGGTTGTFNGTVASDYTIDLTVDTSFSSTSVYSHSGILRRNSGENFKITGASSWNNYVAYGAAFPQVDLDSYTQSDYDLCNGFTKKFLTSAPNGFEMLPYQNFHLRAFSDNGWDTMQITTKDTNGTQVGVYTISNPYSALTGGYEEKFLKIGVGPQDLEDLSSFTVNSGPSDIISSSVTQYDVQVYLNGSPFNYSETKNFKIDCGPYAKYDEYITLMFLDRLGSWGSFAFPMKSRVTHSVNRKTFFKDRSRYNQKQSPYKSTTIQNRGSQQFAISDNREQLVNTKYLTTADAKYFMELVSSPCVYEKIGTTIYPVVIQNGRFEEKKTRNDGLISYSLKYTRSLEEEINI